MTEAMWDDECGACGHAMSWHSLDWDSDDPECAGDQNSGCNCPGFQLHRSGHAVTEINPGGRNG